MPRVTRDLWGNSRFPKFQWVTTYLVFSRDLCCKHRHTKPNKSDFGFDKGLNGDQRSMSPRLEWSCGIQPRSLLRQVVGKSTSPTRTTRTLWIDRTWRLGTDDRDRTAIAFVGGVPSIFYTASLITFPHSSHHSILGISACSIRLLTTLYLNVSSPFLLSSVVVSTRSEVCLLPPFGHFIPYWLRLDLFSFV